MNLLSISLRNVHVRRLSSLLTTLSVALGAALVASLWLMIDQTEQRYRQSYAGYTAVVGPKEGAPLSLVLNTVMNLGFAPGVVPMKVYRELHDGRLARMWRTRYAIPQARGDTYEGFPIVGTTDDWFTKFARGRDEADQPRHLEFQDGTHWTFGHEDLVAFAEEKAAKARALAEEVAHVHEDGEPEHDHAADAEHDHAALPAAWRKAVLGYAVARKLGLGVGATIVPVHGTEALVDHHHDEAASEVVGVLARTGTPIDRAIYVPLSLFLSMDKHAAIRDDPTGQKEAAAISADDVQISAIVYDAADHLVAHRLRYEFQTRQDAQVAWPHIEIAQLLSYVGNAADVLRIVAWLVVAVASIGVCVALYNTMNERRREIAIMRSLGARRGQILAIILLEATLVSLVGAVVGIGLCHGAAWAFAGIVADRTSVTVEWATFTVDELWLILGVTVLGATAGILPAVKGSLTEVADNIGPVS